MFPNLSPGAIGVRANMEESVKLAAAAGFKGVDVGLAEAQSYGIERTKDLFTSNGLLMGGTGLPVEFRKDDKTFNDGLRELPQWAEIAEKLGCTRFNTWVLPGSNEMPFQEHFQLLRNRFRECALILRDHGHRLGLEFIGPKTLRSRFTHQFVYTLPGMLELCDAIGTGNMGLLLDCWHWYTSRGTLEQITSLKPEQVVYVHVNDAPAGIERDEQIDNVRAMPMETGVIDLPGFLKGLEEIGYDGPVTPEPFKKELADCAPTEAVRLTAEAMKKAWHAARITW